MKKIILLILFIQGICLFGLDHGLISGFEIGYNLAGGTTFKQTNREPISVQDYSDTLSVKLTTGYYLGDLKLIGTYTNTLLSIDIDNYKPIQNRYKIELNYQFKNLTFGIYHWCDHPENANKEYRTFLVDKVERKIYIRYYKEF